MSAITTLLFLTSFFLLGNVTSATGNNSSNDLTLTNLTAFLTSAEISSRSLTISLGIITVSQPAFYASIDFSFKPPIGSALPFRLISPVIAMFDLIKIPVSSLTIAVVIAKPADGPSFGIAASGA